MNRAFMRTQRSLTEGSDRFFDANRSGGLAGAGVVLARLGGRHGESLAVPLSTGLAGGKSVSIGYRRPGR